MAVIKHIASKNADYGESERYLIFQHNEYTQKPILDDEGHMILRDEYYLNGLNCDPFTFASECQELNSYYHKNKNFNEIKSHHYIISFDPKDRDECGLTGERAQQLGLTFAKKNFPGHQALVCTHTDGHNESGNIHVHIVINSLRKYDVPQEPYMEFDCESKAGYKHHLSTAYLAHLKQDVMDMCQKEGLHQVDLLSPAERKITEKEYWAQRRGQEKEAARKARTKRLIRIGAEVEAYCGEITDLDAFKDYLQQYSAAIRGTQKKEQKDSRYDPDDLLAFLGQDQETQKKL